MSSNLVPSAALASLWRAGAWPADALERVALTGAEPVLPSSFAVGTAAQVSTAAAALAAAEIGRLRNGLVQDVAVDMRHAALECCAFFTIDGKRLEVWDKLAGLYRCHDGWVRIHTNFAHHRDGVLRLLGLPEGAETPRTAVADALAPWSVLAFEQAASDAGMVVAALRRFDEWDGHPQSAAVAAQPLVAIERIGDPPTLGWSALPRESRPLEGLRVLDLTRILAGPVGTRALAAYGADVLMVNGPHLPNVEAIIDTSRGKRSAIADLRTADGRAALFAALREAHVFVQGYRPGSLAQLGLDAATLAHARPGLVQVSLSAYGDTGPWGSKRGFDSLVQTATGFNHAEAEAAGASEPKALPMQILDMATGMLVAWGAQSALMRQRSEGGSWHVKVSLARTAAWLRELGRVSGGLQGPRPDSDGLMQDFPSAWGELRAVSHAAQFSHTPAAWTRPSVRPGTDRLDWDAQ
jgi:crotonobetainyl-CoA:carnitine CoA-transferase CaiB-like acyl-CoA transferase